MANRQQTEGGARKPLAPKKPGVDTASQMGANTNALVKGLDAGRRANAAVTTSKIVSPLKGLGGSGGGGPTGPGGSGGPGFGGPGGMAPMVDGGAMDEESYLAQDAMLTAALAALDRASKDYEAQYNTDLETYDRDFNQGLDSLGWRDPQDEIQGNFGWDWNDVLTSSGRAFQNTTNDFASRGMLQSQGYLDAQKNLDRSLNDQKGAMDTAKKDYVGGLGRQKAEFQNQDTLARQQARAEATARRQAQYGIV